MNMSPLRNIIVAEFILIFGVAQQVQAQNNTINIACGDTAAFAAAINAANVSPAADTVNLSPGCEYSFNSGDTVNNDSALPRITTSMTINGNGAVIARSGISSFRLLYVDGSGNLTLNAVTVIGGDSAQSGGGILNDGTLTVTNSFIKDNNATGSGGGIHNNHTSTLTVVDSTLSGNSANSFGGGISVSTGSTLTVINSDITDNSASWGGGLFGLSPSSTLTVSDSEISTNSANVYGGGIYNNGTLTVSNTAINSNNANADGLGDDEGGGGIFNAATLTVTDSTLFNNSGVLGGGIANSGTATVTATITNSTLTSNDADSLGGGIYNGGTGTITVTVIRSVFVANTAGGDGGGIYHDAGDGSTLRVMNSAINGNSAGIDDIGGGGIYNDDALFVTSSLFAGNTASHFGGGILNDGGGTLTVTNSTLSGNNAPIGGGGIRSYGMLTVTNSIVWGNSTQIVGSGTVTYSIVEGGYIGGTNIINEDPLFVGYPDLRLQRNSPAINAGSNGELPLDTTDVDGDGNTGETIPYDRSNNARIINGTVDMGAYEWGELLSLSNRNFEDDLDGDKIPNGWTVKNAAGDKMKCNKPGKTFAFEGNCAFKFKGGALEKTKLQREVTAPPGVTFASGDVLTLSAYFNGSNAAVKAKFILKVSYVGVADPVKMNTTVTPSSGYALVPVPALMLTSANIEQIKVMVKHKSTAGKLFVDAASLIVTPAESTRGSDILPVPAAPEGMRGFN